MIDLGETVAGLAEMVGELAAGIFDLPLGFGNPSSRTKAERSRIEIIRLNLSLQKGEPSEKIVESDQPFDAPMK
jgi:hypothetical protein